MRNFLIELLGGVTTHTYDKDVEQARKEARTNTVTKEVVLHRHVLTEPVFEALKKSMNATTIVNSATTDLMAAHQLGIQHALNVLQAGTVVPAPAS